MVTTQIICKCRQLVEVVNKQIVEHDEEPGTRCMASGLKYVPQKISSPYVGGPEVEVIAQGPIECPDCGATGFGALMRVSRGPDPNMN